MVRIGVRKAALDEVSAGLLAVGLHEGEHAPDNIRSVTELALSIGDFSGKEGETALLYADLAAPRLLLVGLGVRSSFTLDKVRRLRDQIRTRGLRVQIEVDGGVHSATIADVAEAGAMLAGFW